MKKSAIGARTKRQPGSAASGVNGATAPSRRSQNAVAMQVLKKFRRALRLTRVNAGSLPKRMPVSSAQMGALRELAEQPGMRVTDLADAMALHQSTISNLIDKLLQKQLVRRKTDSEDGRVVHLYLTAAGERVVLTSPSAAHNALLATLQRLSPKTLRILDRELANLLDRAQG